MFPPEIITITFLFLTFILLVKTAAAATAPPGSTIIFKFSARSMIVFLTSISLTDNPFLRCVLLIGNVILPGSGAKRASHIDLEFFLFFTIEFVFKDNSVSLN